MKSKVAILKCKDYNADKIHAVLERGFDILGGIDSFFKKGEKILLKPNMLSAKKPETGITTHPEFLRACIRCFKKNSDAIAVGDSPGGAVSGVERVWQETGISGSCEKEGANKIVFEKYGSKIIQSNLRNKRIKSLEISNAVFEADALISLPKMKTHTLMLFTGAIKNLYGCISGLRKAHYHFLSTHPDDFGEVLADIAFHIKPRFAIVDAITSMEGEGPLAGSIRKTGLIIMGNDLVAVDAVIAYIMGFDPQRDPTIRAAEKIKLGNSRFAEIDVLGDGKMEDFRISDFKKPSNWKIKMVPRFLGPMIRKIFWAKPKIDDDICTRCQLCLKSCPASAIFREDNRVVVRKDYCIECMCCHEMCPDKAIFIEYSWLADMVTRRSSTRRGERRNEDVVKLGEGSTNS